MMHAARWILVLLFVATSGVALGQTEQQNLVNAADKSLSNFMRDPDMTWLQQNINRAKAVMIAPELVKAGFIFGGSGGRAVVLARDAKSRQMGWPRVLHDGHGKRRLPGGLSVSEAVTLVMT